MAAWDIRLARCRSAACSDFQVNTQSMSASVFLGSRLRGVSPWHLCAQHIRPRPGWRNGLQTAPDEAACASTSWALGSECSKSEMQLLPIEHFRCLLVGAVLLQVSTNSSPNSMLQLNGTRISEHRGRVRQELRSCEWGKDRTLAVLLPGSGSAALIFDSRLDFYAMAALPALRRLLEAACCVAV